LDCYFDLLPTLLFRAYIFFNCLNECFAFPKEKGRKKHGFFACFMSFRASEVLSFGEDLGEVCLQALNISLIPNSRYIMLLED
ncbi:hypothetical protein, partial [Parafilimonas sp.]|uniref:hypothetical protein n=1 Tax=Parafilimonas sp. TaxID=1969739 RepID=UPI0039E6D949